MGNKCYSEHCNLAIVLSAIILSVVGLNVVAPGIWAGWEYLQPLANVLPTALYYFVTPKDIMFFAQAGIQTQDFLVCFLALPLSYSDFSL